jgi:Zn-dependent membrane protease YugP
MYFDPIYFLFAAPGLLLGLWAQWTLRQSFNTYAQVATAGGIDGARAATVLMQTSGVRVGVNSTPGFLTDFYNPADKSINLSESSTQPSIASVAVVAHEMGHALQDAQNYGPMKLRAALVPGVQIGSWAGPLLFIAGMFLNSPPLLWVGIAGFAAAAVFAIATLPVEFDASRRGLAMLEQSKILAPQELPAARAVLQAAALTYVAAAAQSVGTLLYYLSIANRRRS